MKIAEAITTYSETAVEMAKTGSDPKQIARQIAVEAGRAFKDRDERRAVLYGVRENCYHNHGLDLNL